MKTPAAGARVDNSTMPLCHRINTRRLSRVAQSFALVALIATAQAGDPAPAPVVDCATFMAAVPPGPELPSKPVSFRDNQTGILLYVETDGRHLAALGADGKLLWVRNPFEDSKSCPYRTIRPKLIGIAPLPPALERQAMYYMKRNGPFVEIAFNSSQFGAVDLTTGDYLELGQN
jgi:hypothetical protein